MLPDNKMSIDYADDPYEYHEEEKFQDSYFQTHGEGQRTSGFDDEGWKDLQSIDEDFPYINLTPEQLFHREVQKILIFGGIDKYNLGSHDKRTIVGSESKLHWIKLKVPLLYVLGYYVSKQNFSSNSIEYAMGFLRAEKIDEKFELIKYARYWNSILSY